MNGTLAVLNACLAVPSVRKVTNDASLLSPCLLFEVVITSSVAAVTDEPRADHVYTENDWNTTSTLTVRTYSRVLMLIAVPLRALQILTELLHAAQRILLLEGAGGARRVGFHDGEEAAL